MAARRLSLRDAHAGPLPLAGMFAAVTVWGLGNILIKQMSVDGLNVAFYRLWLGSALTVAILIAARHRPTMRELALSAPPGAIFGINMVLGFTAIRITTVADATLIGALQPALVLLVAGAWFGEKIGAREIGWTGVSIAGIAILIAGASSSPEWSPLGDGLALLGVFLFTGYFLASKRIRASVATVAYMAGVQISAAIVVTPVVLLHGLQVSAMTNADWLRITTIVFTSGVGAHMLVNWAHPYVKVSLSSVIVLLTPVVSSIAAWAVLDESLTGIQLVGGAVTLVAIVVITQGHRSGEEGALTSMAELPEPTIVGS
jgi:drug/metabolite transporter (DMT)-like permease